MSLVVVQLGRYWNSHVTMSEFLHLSLWSRDLKVARHCSVHSDKSVQFLLISCYIAITVITSYISGTQWAWVPDTDILHPRPDLASALAVYSGYAPCGSDAEGMEPKWSHKWAITQHYTLILWGGKEERERGGDLCSSKRSNCEKLV